VNLSKYDNVFFIGIGGIGMSALARWFSKEGKRVEGYDKTCTPLTESLVQEGIRVFCQDDISEVGKVFLDTENTLIIFTPAIPKDTGLYKYFSTSGHEVLKRAQVLGVISQNYYTVGVAGTHGKTTTSSILAHLLYQANRNVTCFVGGILKNYNSNLIYRNDGDGEHIVVVEADEFDRSFLRLSPNASIITTVDPDHLDIYQDDKSFNQAFVDYANLLPQEGVLVKHQEVKLDTKVREVVYGDDGEASIQNLKVENGYQCFDYVYGSKCIKNINLYVPGHHNVMNTVAAITVALELGVSDEKIIEGVQSYRGVKRRFEYIIKNEKVIYLDDYAHHPSEIKAFVSAVRELFPNKKMTVLFQPHLYSRTRDFAENFAEELAKIDELLLMDIYPARELPIDGVNAEWLLSKVNNTNKRLVKEEEIVDVIKNIKTDIVVTLGAGDIDRFVEPIKEMLERESR